MFLCIEELPSYVFDDCVIVGVECWQSTVFIVSSIIVIVGLSDSIVVRTISDSRRLVVVVIAAHSNEWLIRNKLLISVLLSLQLIFCFRFPFNCNTKQEQFITS
jgi:hypothetical protein